MSATVLPTTTEPPLATTTTVPRVTQAPPSSTTTAPPSTSAPTTLATTTSTAPVAATIPEPRIESIVLTRVRGAVSARTRIVPTSERTEVWARPPGGAWQAIGSGTGATLTTTVPSAFVGKVITMAVRAMPAGATTCSSGVACTSVYATDVQVMAEVPLLSAGSASPSDVQLRWAALGATPFRNATIRMSRSSSSVETFLVTNTLAGAYRFYGLNAGSSYVASLSVSQRLNPSVSSYASIRLTTDAWDPMSVKAHAGALVSHVGVPNASALWVSPSGTGTTCSALAPCPLAKGIAAVGNGGTVVLMAGTYREASLGVIRKRVTIMADPGTRPVLSGMRAVTGSWQSAGSGVYFRDDLALNWPAIPSWATLKGQTEPNRPEADDPEQLIVGGVRMRQIDPSMWVSAGAMGTNQFYYDRSRIPARLYVRTTVNPASARVEWATQQRAVKFTAGSSGSTVLGVSFDGYAPYHGNALAAVEVFADNVRLEDVSVRYSSATGIVAGGHNSELPGPLRGFTLRRVTASNNGGVGAAIGDAGPTVPVEQGHENDAVVEFSRIDGNNTEGFATSACGAANACVMGGIKVARLDGFTVRYSSFAGNGSNGLWADLFCQNGRIVGNYVAGNTRTGIFYEVSRSGLVASNVIANNNTSNSPLGAGIKITGSGDAGSDGTVPGVVVERNTFVANLNAQVLLGYDLRSPSGGNIGWQLGRPWSRLVGNTFVEGTQGTPTSGRQIIRTVMADVSQLDPSWVDGSRSDRNHYVLADNSATSAITRFVWGASRYTTPAAFSTVSGAETHSTVTVRAGDPSAGVFVAPSSGDYRLTAAAGSRANVALSDGALAALDSPASTPVGSGAHFTTPR